MSVTTGLTIGTAVFPTLTAQPFGYEESSTRDGRTAQQWAITGLLTPSEWLTLVNAYQAWRDLRIEDEDTLISLEVGTTISFSGKGPGNQTWTNVCWFTSAPAAESAGRYLAVSVTLIDANEALQVFLKEQEIVENLPDFGTLSYGSGESAVVVTLTAEPYARQDGPQVALSATGTSYLTGPLKAHKIRNVEGYISTGTFASLLSWYDATILNSPQSNAWFPITPPTATAEVIITGGVKATRYNVTMTELQIL